MHWGRVEDFDLMGRNGERKWMKKAYLRKEKYLEKRKKRDYEKGRKTNQDQEL